MELRQKVVLAEQKVASYPAGASEMRLKVCIALLFLAMAREAAVTPAVHDVQQLASMHLRMR